MLTREMLMRFNVVAAYHRYDSAVPKSLIQPDHSTKHMIEKDRNVSMARKSLGFLKMRPAWAMVQYSTGDSWPERWKNTLARFMARSTEAQAMISHPKKIRKDDCSTPPVRMLRTPKSSLKMQKGTPMVRARKVGVWKKLGSTFCKIFWAGCVFISLDRYLT